LEFAVSWPPWSDV